MQSIQKLNRFYPLFLYYSKKERRKVSQNKEKDKSIQPLNRLHVSALSAFQNFAAIYSTLRLSEI